MWMWIRKRRGACVYALINKHYVAWCKTNNDSWLDIFALNIFLSFQYFVPLDWLSYDNLFLILNLEKWYYALILSSFSLLFVFTSFLSPFNLLFTCVFFTLVMLSSFFSILFHSVYFIFSFIYFYVTISQSFFLHFIYSLVFFIPFLSMFPLSLGFLTYQIVRPWLHQVHFVRLQKKAKKR